MAYAIKRTYGTGKNSGSDYLLAWCRKWGTACIGSAKLAMTFDSKAAADAAAARSQAECKGFGGAPAVGITFSVVEI